MASRERSAIWLRHQVLVVLMDASFCPICFSIYEPMTDISTGIMLTKCLRAHCPKSWKGDLQMLSSLQRYILFLISTFIL